MEINNMTASQLEEMAAEKKQQEAIAKEEKENKQIEVFNEVAESAAQLLKNSQFELKISTDKGQDSIAYSVQGSVQMCQIISLLGEYLPKFIKNGML